MAFFVSEWESCILRSLFGISIEPAWNFTFFILWANAIDFDRNQSIDLPLKSLLTYLYNSRNKPPLEVHYWPTLKAHARIDVFLFPTWFEDTITDSGHLPLLFRTFSLSLTRLWPVFTTHSVFLRQRLNYE